MPPSHQPLQHAKELPQPAPGGLHDWPHTPSQHVPLQQNPQVLLGAPSGRQHLAFWQTPLQQSAVDWQG